MVESLFCAAYVYYYFINYSIFNTEIEYILKILLLLN